MRGLERTQVGAAQRTASMPRGLAAAFIVFAFIVCFSGEQQQGSSSSSCARRQRLKPTRQQCCGDERRLITVCKGALVPERARNSSLSFELGAASVLQTASKIINSHRMHEQFQPQIRFPVLEFG